MEMVNVVFTALELYDFDAFGKWLMAYNAVFGLSENYTSERYFQQKTEKMLVLAIHMAGISQNAIIAQEIDR